MKDKKRALRRHQQLVKFKKRLDQWLYGCNYELVETRNEAILGVSLTFLRTTARPCNCWCCSNEHKYVREQKQYVVKKVLKEIADENAPVAQLD